MKSLNWILPLAFISLILGGCSPSNDSNSLNELKTLNESLSRSNSMFDDRNDSVVCLIERERRNQPEKVDEVLGLVKKVRSKSNDINTYINGLIQELNESQNDGDLLIGNKLLAEGKDGQVLLNKLAEYKKSHRYSNVQVSITL